MRSRRLPLWACGPALPLIVGCVVLAVWPASFARCCRFALHGFCAQNILHSYWFGGTPLPYDGRENGMYPGIGVAVAYVISSKRMWRAAVPRWPLIAALAVGPIGLALDGVNSLLTDLRLWHPWTSSNASRLLSGYGTGLAIGITLCWLYGASCVRMSRPGSIVDKLVTVVVLWIPAVPFLLLHTSGCAWLYDPLALMLVVLTWATLTALICVMLLLATKRDDLITRVSDLMHPLAWSGWGAILVMIVFAVGRVLLEHAMGVPSTL